MASSITLPTDLPRVRNIHFRSFSSCSFAKFRQNHSSFETPVCFENNAIIFVKQGSKIMHHAKSRFVIAQNEALFLKSGTYTLSNITLENGAYEAWLFFFDNAFLLSLMQKYHALRKKPHQRISAPALKSNHAQLLDILQSFAPYFEDNTQIFEPLVELKFEEIFAFLLLHSDEFSAFVDEIFSALSLKYMDLFSHCDEAFLSVAQMAQYAKSDISSFSKTFKHNFKLSPKQYIDEKRFKKAQHLLINSTQNINEICTTCGFSSPSWFIKRFKNRYGQTPKQFQKTAKI